MKSIEAKFQEAASELEKARTKIKELETKLNEAAVATAKAQRDGQLKESGLPEPSVKRISEAFAKSTDNAGLKEAISTEEKYVQELGGKIKRNNGPAAAVDESEKQTDELRESQYKAYKKSGMTEEVAQRMSGFTPKK